MHQDIFHVSLVVRDYDEAIAFFCRTLHFTLIDDTYQPEQDKRWVVVAPPGGGGTSLLLARASTPEQQAVVGNQAGGRVFLFLETDDFQRDFDAMRAAGVAFVRAPKHEPYGTVAVFEDLYGNRWDLVQRKRKQAAAAPAPTTRPAEPWLRGPIEGIPALLQPAAHALIMAREDVAHATTGLDAHQVWARPGGIAPIGFHLMHLAGSTDRLFTYARGAALSGDQRLALARERAIAESGSSLEELMAEWQRVVVACLAQLAATAETGLGKRRAVGRAQLPSTVLGLIFHAAEHASRHTGQVVTTARLVRAL